MWEIILVQPFFKKPTSELNLGYNLEFQVQSGILWITWVFDPHVSWLIKAAMRILAGWLGGVVKVSSKSGSTATCAQEGSDRPVLKIPSLSTTMLENVHRKCGKCDPASPARSLCDFCILLSCLSSLGLRGIMLWWFKFCLRWDSFSTPWLSACAVLLDSILSPPPPCYLKATWNHWERSCRWCPVLPFFST